MPKSSTTAAKPISRKNRLPYDVCHVFIGKPPILTTREAYQLKTALKADPSKHFKKMYEFAIANYIEYAMEIKKVSPKEVGRRVKKAASLAKELREAIEHMTITDRVYVHKFSANEMPSTPGDTVIDQLYAKLVQFSTNASDAIADMKVHGKMSGAMPGYAKQQLAITILRALYVDTGTVPPNSRGKLFDRVLKCALDTATTRIGEGGKWANEVMELMRFAKGSFDTTSAESFGRYFE